MKHEEFPINHRVLVAPTISMLTNDYYDLDSILSEEQPLPCSFNVGATGLGYLDNTTHEKHLHAEDHLDLPLWMALPLANFQYARVEMPFFFTEKSRRELESDPFAHDLSKNTSHFFRLGMRLAETFKITQLSTTMNELLGKRFQKILDFSQLYRTVGQKELYEKLAHLEKDIFDAKLRSTVAFHEWKDRPISQIKESRTVSALKRRRLV